MAVVGTAGGSELELQWALVGTGSSRRISLDDAEIAHQEGVERGPLRDGVFSRRILAVWMSRSGYSSEEMQRLKAQSDRNMRRMREAKDSTQLSPADLDWLLRELRNSWYRS